MKSTIYAESAHTESGAVVLELLSGCYSAERTLYEKKTQDFYFL